MTKSSAFLRPVIVLIFTVFLMVVALISQSRVISIFCRKIYQRPLYITYIKMSTLYGSLHIGLVEICPEILVASVAVRAGRKDELELVQIALLFVGNGE